MTGLKIRVAALTAGFAVLMPGFAPDPRAEEGPLSRMVQIAFARGFGGPLSGKICTALGVTQDNQPFPVEQLSSAAGGDTRSFNVSRHRGRLDVILALKTKGVTVVFLTSATGALEKAVVDTPKQAIRDYPLEDAMPVFEKEKSWWLNTWLNAHYPDPARQ